MTASPRARLVTGRQLSLSKVANNPVVSFLPWIVFWVIGGGLRQWELSCLAATATAVLVLLLDVLPRGPRQADEAQPGFVARLRAPKMLNVATLVFFIIFSLFQPLLPLSGLIPVEIYSGLIADGTLALLVITSILTGHAFTEQYARETTPERLWHTAAFRHINLVISWVWAAAFGVSAFLALLAVLSYQAGAMHQVLVWYAPIALLVAAFTFTRQYPDRVRARARAQAAETLTASGRPSA
jgi:hypothetical protein